MRRRSFFKALAGALLVARSITRNDAPAIVDAYTVETEASIESYVTLAMQRGAEEFGLYLNAYYQINA